MDYKKAIKRHLKRGTFETIRTSKRCCSITANNLKNDPNYYVERKRGGLVVLNTKLNHLTLYIEKQQM